MLRAAARIMPLGNAPLFFVKNLASLPTRYISSTMGTSAMSVVHITSRLFQDMVANKLSSAYKVMKWVADPNFPQWVEVDLQESYRQTFAGCSPVCSDRESSYELFLANKFSKNSQERAQWLVDNFRGQAKEKINFFLESWAPAYPPETQAAIKKSLFEGDIHKLKDSLKETDPLCTGEFKLFRIS